MDFVRVLSVRENHHCHTRFCHAHIGDSVVWLDRCAGVCSGRLRCRLAGETRWEAWVEPGSRPKNNKRTERTVLGVGGWLKFAGRQIAQFIISKLYAVEFNYPVA